LRGALQIAQETRADEAAARQALLEVLENRIRWGGKAAKSELLELSLPDLQAASKQAMRRERPDHTLQPTILFNDEFIYVRKQIQNDWEDRRTLVAYAKRRIRNRLIGHARGHEARLKGFKRLAGDIQDMDLPEASNDPSRSGPSSSETKVQTAALAKLKASHPRQYEVLLLHNSPRYTLKTIAELMGFAEKTASRDYDFARRFLKSEIRKAFDEGEAR
jgi:RNA polymerase sigma factor (sigma-70 family)